MHRANGPSTMSRDRRDTHQESITRKSFLSRLGVYTWLGSVGLALLGSVRTAIPSVLPDPSLRFRIGRPHDFALGGARYFEQENVTVFRDDQGIFAISTICTHLGCVVRRSEEGFLCPCHGSTFDSKGEVTRGPAPKPLLWYAVAQSTGGALYVDRGKSVNVGTKYHFDIKEA